MPKKGCRCKSGAKRVAEWRQSQDQDELRANDAKRKRESR